jgi:hypothetical protein
MREEYDFSKGKRGKYYNKNATMKLPVYLESDVLDYFSAKAKAEGVDLSQLVSDQLKRDIAKIEGSNKLSP